MAYKIGYKIKSKEEMGSCCGNEQAKEQGMLLVQGSGRRAVSGMELDEEEGKRVISKFRPFVKSIIKLQAIWRGHLVRTKVLPAIRDSQLGEEVKEVRELDDGVPEIPSLLTKQL